MIEQSADVVTINTDDFLEMASGRVWTPERSKEAWRQCYAALESAIERMAPPVRVAVVCDVQGSGKST